MGYFLQPNSVVNRCGHLLKLRYVMASRLTGLVVNRVRLRLTGSATTLPHLIRSKEVA